MVENIVKLEYTIHGYVLFAVLLEEKHSLSEIFSIDLLHLKWKESFIMTHLKVGEKAPYFSGINQNSKNISLSNYSNKKLILYFYPKDNTPGCTIESCNLNENYSKLIKEGFQIIGVSPDDEKSHLKFIAKYNFSFDLIADVEKTICISYGVWGKKKFMGREYDGVHRTTFVINKDQIIQKIFTKVDTKNHSQQILESYK